MLLNIIKKLPAYQTAFRHYDNLAPREKTYLQVMVVSLVLAFLYFVVWLPSHQYKVDSHKGLDSARQTLVFVKENIAVAKSVAASNQVAQTGQIDPQTMVSKVSALGKKRGIELKRFEPSGDNRIRIWIEDMPFNAMVQWLQELEKQHGLKVAELSLDRDDKAGLVNARLLIGP